MAVMLEARGLGYGYPGRAVGRDLNLALGAGEVLCVLGPNGGGKTTLFRTLLGLLEAQAGEVRLQGESLDALPRGEVARRMGYVPQGHAAQFAFTVRDVVLMGRTAHIGLFAAPGAADRAAADRAIEVLGIGAGRLVRVTVDAPGGVDVERIADLEAVLEHLAGHPSLDGRFGLLGSSLGGFVALWVASRRHRVMPVVTWNAPANLASLAASLSADVTSPGAALVAEVRAGRHLDAPAGASHVLVVQGQADDVVPPGHAQILFERAGKPRELCLLPGADHRLSDPFHRLEAVKRSRDWFTHHLHTEPA